MKTINSVTLRGRVSKDPELKSFSNGGSLAKLIVCTENNYKNKDGEWQKHPVICWQVTQADEQTQPQNREVNYNRSDAPNGDDLRF